MNELGKILSAPEIKKCSNCGNDFTAYYENSELCSKCQFKIENKNNYLRRKEFGLLHKKKNKIKKEKLIEIKENEILDEDVDVLDEIEIEPNRKCHDCGKPTNNYRCKDCLINWKKKNGIQLDENNY